MLRFTFKNRITHILIQPTISLEMPVPSQGHYGFDDYLSGAAQREQTKKIYKRVQII
jgi:hypothetical protein